MRPRRRAADRRSHPAPPPAKPAAGGGVGAAGWPRRHRPCPCRRRGRRPDRAAALGHALAGAQRHLAGRVLVEAAGQARVAGVLGQPLELLGVLGREVDVEVAHPGDHHAVGGELLVAVGDHGLLDLGRVDRQPQDRPAVAHDLGGDVGAHDLQQLVADPAGDACRCPRRRRCRAGW